MILLCYYHLGRYVCASTPFRRFFLQSKCVIPTDTIGACVCVNHFHVVDALSFDELSSFDFVGECQVLTHIRRRRVCLFMPKMKPPPFKYRPIHNNNFTVDKWLGPRKRHINLVYIIILRLATGNLRCVETCLGDFEAIYRCEGRMFERANQTK